MGQTFRSRRSHQTFGPSILASAGSSGPGFDTTGLIMWHKGDADLQTYVEPDDGLLVHQWLDQTSFHQDIAEQLPINPGPFAGLDTIDTIPCISFALNGGFGANTLRGLFRADVRDRNGNIFGYGPGERQQRTIAILLMPRYSAGVFNITGGIIEEMGSTPAWQPLFDLEPNFGNPNGFYLFSAGAWRGAANTGPDTPGGVGGTYNGVPTLVMFFSNGFPDLGIAINGTNTVIVPPNIPGLSGPTLVPAFSLGRQSSGGFNFFGAMAERMMFDYDLRTAPTVLANVVTYYRNRYPSAPIV